MASYEYSLFRTKFIRPPQSLLFENALTTEQIFLKGLRERPFVDLKKGYRWHIGNLKFYTHETGYFAVGRTTDDTIETFDKETGDFVEEELETSPYTHCVFDAKIGFIGIAKKFELAGSCVGIAERVQQLLENTKVVFENEINVVVSAIPDPDGFIKTLKSAYQVSRFTATFKGPNPFDADKFFQKPLSVYCAEANAESGKTTIQGKDLNRDTIVAVAHSTAATGNQASARLKKSRNQKAITVTLRDNPIKRRYDAEEHDPKLVLQDLTEVYKKVRNNE